MNHYETGAQLVFLVSQPRSGSTLLQRMLGRSSDVYTRSEEWLLLKPLWGLARNELPGTAPYDAMTAQQALGHFIERLPGGMPEYYRACGRMYGALYGRMLEDSGRRLYLDKTPRYYAILEEIAGVFPEAKFILLARHPVAVMHSLLGTFHRGDWSRLYLHKADLLQAPRLILEAKARLGGRVCWVSYEKLVAEPVSEVRRICDFIKAGFDESMIHTYHQNMERWTLGDPITVYSRRGVNEESVDAWRRSLVDAQFRKAAAGYVEALGADVLADFGYPVAEEKELWARRPSRAWDDLGLVSWNTLMEGTNHSQWKIWLAQKLRLRGYRY